jgi:hypothetical protein
MRLEAENVLNAIAAYNRAHVGDSDDVEIDAAFNMEDAALALVRVFASQNTEIAELLDNFERNEALVR